MLAFLSRNGNLLAANFNKLRGALWSTNVGRDLVRYKGISPNVEKETQQRSGQNSHSTRKGQRLKNGELQKQGQ